MVHIEEEEEETCEHEVEYEGDDYCKKCGLYLGYENEPRADPSPYSEEEPKESYIQEAEREAAEYMCRDHGIDYSEEEEEEEQPKRAESRPITLREREEETLEELKYHTKAQFSEEEEEEVVDDVSQLNYDIVLKLSKGDLGHLGKSDRAYIKRVVNGQVIVVFGEQVNEEEEEEEPEDQMEREAKEQEETQDAIDKQASEEEEEELSLKKKVHKEMADDRYPLFYIVRVKHSKIAIPVERHFGTRKEANDYIVSKRGQAGVKWMTIWDCMDITKAFEVSEKEVETKEINFHEKRIHLENAKTLISANMSYKKAVSAINEIDNALEYLETEKKQASEEEEEELVDTAFGEWAFVFDGGGDRLNNWQPEWLAHKASSRKFEDAKAETLKYFQRVNKLPFRVKVDTSCYFCSEKKATPKQVFDFLKETDLFTLKDWTSFDFRKRFEVSEEEEEEGELDEVTEKAESIINQHKYYTDTYPDTADDSEFEDDACIHIVRNHRRYCFYDAQDEDNGVVLKERDVKRFAKFVDEAFVKVRKETEKKQVKSVDEQPEKVMKFEIINPSDEAYIEGDFKVCCLATLAFGEGAYGLTQVGGDLEMPLLLFGTYDKWLKTQFGKTLKELISETSKEDIGKALMTVHLVRERSSLNDFTSYANQLGKHFLGLEQERAGASEEEEEEVLQNTKPDNWFAVNKEGLKELHSNVTPFRLCCEIIQNAWDEDIKECNVSLKSTGRVAYLQVVDDSPDGFRDMRDSYTLFGHTLKRGDPTKRGRFNLGEKVVLSVALEGEIRSTKGMVAFKENGNRVEDNSQKTGSGSIFWAKFLWDEKEIEETNKNLKKLLAPKGILTTINRKELGYIEPDYKQKAVLPTVIFENKIKLVPQRKTELHIHHCNGTSGATGTLYEMGIPLCELDCPYNVNVQQKIPQSMDRDLVSSNYLKAIYAEVLNATIDDLGDEIDGDWVRNGIGNKRSTDVTRKKVLDKRYGKVLIASNTDQRSIQEAKDAGYQVLDGRLFDKAEREALKEVGLQTTAQVFDTRIVKEEIVEPTKEEQLVASYTKMLGKELLGLSINVLIVESPRANYVATFQRDTNRLAFNRSTLDKAFFNETVSVETTSLILHELAHVSEGAHVDRSYVIELQVLGGKAVQLAIDRPELFKEFVEGVMK